MYELDVDEDVNRVLFALPFPVHLSTPRPQQKQGKGKKQTKQSTSTSKQIEIDGSADAVKLLTSQLAQVLHGTTQQSVAAAETMLHNLSLVR